MAIEYAKSALSESIIPVKDVPLKVTSGLGVTPVTYVNAPIGNLVQINTSGVVDVVTVTAGLVGAQGATLAGYGVSEGTNFEGLGVAPKVGKVRISGNAIYRAPYGTITTTAGADQGKFASVTPTQALVGTTKAIGFNSKENNDGTAAKGFVVHSDDAASNKIAKIVDFDNRGNVFFQFVSSALFTS